MFRFSNVCTNVFECVYNIWWEVTHFVVNRLSYMEYYNGMYGLLTKCEVKMAGYRPSSFFACLWTETKSRSINSKKKRTRPISSHLDRTNLVNKEFIVWLLEKLCLRDTAVSPERARWLHLARSGSLSQRPIWFILPARGASHTINMEYYIVMDQ